MESHRPFFLLLSSLVKATEMIQSGYVLRKFRA